MVGVFDAVEVGTVGVMVGVSVGVAVTVGMSVAVKRGVKLIIPAERVTVGIDGVGVVAAPGVGVLHPASSSTSTPLSAINLRDNEILRDTGSLII
jgi:hypothetical protein